MVLNILKEARNGSPTQTSHEPSTTLRCSLWLVIISSGSRVILMMGEVTERQNSDSTGEEGKKKRRWTETWSFLLHTQAITKTKSSLRVRSEGGGRRGRARWSPGNKTFSLCVYDACQTNDLKSCFYFWWWWWRYEVSFKKRKKNKQTYICMIKLRGGAWGSICKMCVFFSVVFFIFYNNYLFFFRVCIG